MAGLLRAGSWKWNRNLRDDARIVADLRAANVVKDKAKKETVRLKRGLEEVMLDVMYDAPSQKQIKEVIITEDSISGKNPPIRIFEQDKDAKSA